MNAKEIAEKICAEWDGWSEKHPGEVYLLAVDYIDLEKRLAAANEVVEAAKKMDGYHSINCEMTHMAERAKYCDCGICDLRIAMQKFESANKAGG